MSLGPVARGNLIRYLGRWAAVKYCMADALRGQAGGVLGNRSGPHSYRRAKKLPQAVCATYYLVGKWEGAAAEARKAENAVCPEYRTGWQVSFV